MGRILSSSTSARSSLLRVSNSAIVSVCAATSFTTFNRVKWFSAHYRLALFMLSIKLSWVLNWSLNLPRVELNTLHCSVSWDVSDYTVYVHAFSIAYIFFANTLTVRVACFFKVVPFSSTYFMWLCRSPMICYIACIFWFVEFSDSTTSLCLYASVTVD